MPKKSARKPASRHRSTPEAVSVTAFKDSCLSLIDRVRRTREEIVVTKYGRPVAKLVAFDQGNVSLFGRLRGSVTIRGDIVGPLDVEWDAEA